MCYLGLQYHVKLRNETNCLPCDTPFNAFQNEMHFLAVALHRWFILFVIRVTLRCVFAVFLACQEFTMFTDVCFWRIIFYISRYCFFPFWFLGNLSNLSIVFGESDLTLPSVCVPCCCFEIIRVSLIQIFKHK